MKDVPHDDSSNNTDITMALTVYNPENKTIRDRLVKEKALSSLIEHLLVNLIFLKMVVKRTI